MLVNTPTTTYAVLVNGTTVASRLATRQIAEAMILGLPPEQRALAEIVPTTANGQTLLLG